MIIDDFIVNLMSQHVVPFWVTLSILFFVVMEVIYKNLVKTQRRRCGLLEFTIFNKFSAIFLTFLIFVAIYFVGVVIEILSMIIIPLLITIGVLGIVVAFFYANYLVAKKYSKSYNFRSGQKLRVVDVEGLATSALIKTPKDSIVTCIEKIEGKNAYRVRTANKKIAERKEWRFESA